MPADIESQEALDFPRVLSHLSGHARTLCGKEAALSLPLATTVEDVEAHHRACREFKQVVEAGADPTR